MEQKTIGKRLSRSFRYGCVKNTPKSHNTILPWLISVLILLSHLGKNAVFACSHLSQMRFKNFHCGEFVRELFGITTRSFRITVDKS